MLYSAYQWQSDLAQPVYRLAEQAKVLLQPFKGLPGLSGLSASWEMIARARLTHSRPQYGISKVLVGNRQTNVSEHAHRSTPFGTLLHFRKDIETVQPRVLLVAPLSGHFATLLRGTVETMLPEHDVFITDWHNARDIPPEAGQFGFDEYIQHIISWLEAIGPDTHLIAVCQPCVHALAAVALMAEDKNPAQPASMTLMAGPVDTRVNPTKVNCLANEKTLGWFEENLISEVPAPHKGAGRLVYPGFLQLAAFMSMNAPRHTKTHRDLYRALVSRDKERSGAIKTFYDEYFAVLDLTAEFYLETVAKVFQDAQLAKGELIVAGRRVNPAAIKKTALLTVEGERDDICAPGQTVAAHDLCTGLRPYMKRHHMQAGVGHYGVFSGRKWEGQIYPVVRNMMMSMI